MSGSEISPQFKIRARGPEGEILVSSLCPNEHLRFRILDLLGILPPNTKIEIQKLSGPISREQNPILTQAYQLERLQGRSNSMGPLDRYDVMGSWVVGNLADDLLN